VRRLTASLGLALSLLGCDLAGLPSERVELLTGIEACYAGGARPAYAGVLAPDPYYGTRFDAGPAMWPVGYTGVRLIGGQVAVLNAGGDLVAMTGKAYAITPVPEVGESGRELARVGAIGVCDSYEWDLEEVPAQP
jgi:hypothetical protein